MNDQNPVPGFAEGLAPLSRRGLLRAVAVGGMAISAGCSSLSPARIFGREENEDVSEYTHLTPEQVLVIEKLVKVHLPTERFGLPSSLNEIPTVKNVDDMVGQMSPELRQLFDLGIWVFDRRSYASIRVRRFSNMTDTQATRYVLAMQQATFPERGLTASLKALVTFNYWRDARTWPALEYWGPVTEKWGVRRLGNAPLPPV